MRLRHTVTDYLMWMNVNMNACARRLYQVRRVLGSCEAACSHEQVQKFLLMRALSSDLRTYRRIPLIEGLDIITTALSIRHISF